MKSLYVSFNHHCGTSEITVNIDEGVLKESIDEESLQEFIEMITDLESVQIIDMDFSE